MSYIDDDFLTARGITPTDTDSSSGMTASALIPMASEHIDLACLWPTNDSGYKFPRQPDVDGNVPNDEGVVPLGVQRATAEQVRWIMQKGLEYVTAGAAEQTQVNTFTGSSSKKSTPISFLSPTARAYLKPYMARVRSSTNPTPAPLVYNFSQLTGELALSQIAQESATDGQGIFWSDAEGAWVVDDQTGGASDASSSVKGVTRLSVDPDVASAPIALGVNDPLLDALNDALTQTDLDNAIAAHAAGSDVHTIAGTTGLQAALDGKASTTHGDDHLADGSDPITWATVIAAGLNSARPAAAAGNDGYLWLSTDVNGGTLYRSNGTSWVQTSLGVTERASDADTVDGSHAASLLARANHTGTQPMSTISDAGDSATKDVGSGAGQVAAGDHNHSGVYSPVSADGAKYVVMEAHGDLSAEVLLGTAIGYGVAASRPTAATDATGYLYFSTDTDTLERCNGTGWDALTLDLGQITGATDLQAIEALSPTNDDIIQRKAGAWTNRTMAQLQTDLEAAGQPYDFVIVFNGDETITFPCPRNMNIDSIAELGTGAWELKVATVSEGTEASPPTYPVAVDEGEQLDWISTTTSGAYALRIKGTTR